MKTLHFHSSDDRSCHFGQPKGWVPYRFTLDPNEVTCRACMDADTFVLSETAQAWFDVVEGRAGALGPAN